MAQVESTSGKRILFIGEAVTLAHVVRPVVLASALEPGRYAITLACDSRYHRLFPELPFPMRAIRTIPVAQFLEALAKGDPVYDTDTLRAYVKEDLALIDAVKPDLVVGDFRISLWVATRLAKVPYFTITNAYWSPYSQLPFPLPEHPLADRLGVAPAQFLFNIVRPLVFALHTLPMNRVCREYGLPGLGMDLRAVYTQADQTLYADIPGLVPTKDLPPNHHWLGPILWSPSVSLPPWWEALPDQPVIYVTLGSSGEGDRVLPLVFEGLAKLPVTVIAATAGRPTPANLPSNVRVADFLPGTEAAARSSLVICNGGSPTTQQALAAGVPVIGVAGNMDQHLNMLCLERAGVGIRLRAGQLTPEQIKTTAERLLRESNFREAAERLKKQMQDHSTGAVFRERVATLLLE